MKKSRLLGAVCASTLVALANTAHAAVVNPISGLSIGGTLYDVTFHDGTVDSFNKLWDADNNGVFGGGGSLFMTEPTFWGDEVGAKTARDAIITALGTVDATTGMSDSFFIPYKTSSTGESITAGTDRIWAAYDEDTFTSTETPLAGDVVHDSGTQLAQISPYASFAPSAIPLPASLWLFGSGLLGLVGIARRKKAA